MGLLDVGQAMQAQAPAASFVAAQTALANFSSLTMSALFGGASVIGRSVGGMTVFDRYGRDYRMTAATGVRTRGTGLLAGGMLAPVDPPWLTSASTITDARLGFTSTVPDYWRQARPNRPSMVAFSPALGQSVTLGANVVVGGSGGVAGSPLRAVVATPVGMSSAWSGDGWSAGFSAGSSRDGRASLRSASFAMPSGFGFELSELAERGRVLGMSQDVGVGQRGARTTMASLTVRRMVVGIPVSARVTAATTRVDGGSDTMRFTGPVIGTAFAVEGAHGLFGGTATFGLSSPLRVERARVMMLMPVSYDLVSGTLTTRTGAVDLTPDARELDLEFGWSRALSPNSSVRFGVAHAFDAGHVAGAVDTAGFATLTIR
ncbi:hypothetical protein GCM10020258_27070 [Sphingomonas yabuuchiae]